MSISDTQCALARGVDAHSGGSDNVGHRTVWVRPSVAQKLVEGEGRAVTVGDDSVLVEAVVVTTVVVIVIVADTGPHSAATAQPCTCGLTIARVATLARDVAASNQTVVSTGAGSTKIGRA